MSKPSQKLLKAELKRLGVKKVFPRSKGVGRVAFSPYQVKKIRATLKKEKAHFIADTKNLHYKTDDVKILIPTVPDVWIAGGFRYDLSEPARILANSRPINIHTLYTDTDAQYYSANFFGGIIHAIFLPSIAVVPYLLELREMEDMGDDKWYDQLCFREGDRDMHGGAGLSKKFDTAEGMILYLEQYKRHGSLINEETSFGYIQLCFIQYEFH